MANQRPSLNKEQKAMLRGDQGEARQMAMRLLLDLAAAAGAGSFSAINSAHLSGVSPLTGGMGLRRFLKRLVKDPRARVAVPTTLNAAGCDAAQFARMRIAVPGFLEESQEIVSLYTTLGVRPIQSCVPYEWDGVVTKGVAAWAESNAICFGNSYCDLKTNRESGLSALASALTGYTPDYGLLEDAARRPNIEVIVSCEPDDPTDFSILGDWIGKQQKGSWHMPFGPIPLIRGLPKELTHEQRKALSAAAANYGSPLVYIEGEGQDPEEAEFQARLVFGEAELGRRYDELRPRAAVSLITIGCPQASIGELRQVAHYLKGKRVAAAPDEIDGRPPLWIFTSAAGKAIAEKTGLAEIIRESGALLLENTCPEVVPYDPGWVSHILTNSMKAEHYIKSGLNGIPTSVMRLKDCIDIASGQAKIGGEGEQQQSAERKSAPAVEPAARATKAKIGGIDGKSFAGHGKGLPSQGDFTVQGEAFVSEAPITFLGFVNRESGVVEEPGHPADGRSMAGRIAIFPKGSGSTVAPYVLLELYYRGKAPVAIVNTEIDQQSAPACSLEGIPYAYGFGDEVVSEIEHGDIVELRRKQENVTIRLLKRRGG